MHANRALVQRAMAIYYHGARPAQPAHSKSVATLASASSTIAGGAASSLVPLRARRSIARG
jgi:hypothetical protein